MKVPELVFLPDGTTFNFRHFVGMAPYKQQEGPWKAEHTQYTDGTEIVLHEGNGQARRLFVKLPINVVADIVKEANEKWGRK